ncbi:valine--tRNA ligase [Candidatus Dependentiae bacterium]|nr:valine--tRNA ligase [Candidatus Dependentiae bacterium]
MENSRYEHSIYDEQIRILWQQTKTYQKQIKDFTPFTIDTPPPTVSGSLHIGHIFSYTHTDIIARYKRMTGHNVFYPFGFDCNGLATERFVEKKHNTNVSKIGREKFINLCLSTTEEMKVKFVDLWRTIGLSANFNDHTYSTISPEVQKISQESFIRLVKKGYCYIKEEPALYCTRCRTTVAQAELDDSEQSTTFNTIAFNTINEESVSIATTRPELLPSCVALIYHPADQRYQHLKNSKAIVPIFNQQVPFLEDELVSIEKGTGLVMVCTFGDKTDIEWYKKHSLPFVQSIGFDGKFTNETELLAGLTVPEARTRIIEKLKEKNILLEQKTITNNIHVHERCKYPIEYTILPQWFINVVKHKEKFLQAAATIQWHPEHMKARFVDWVSNLSWDWCISRQRVFGIPFPVWYCNDCHEIITAPLEALPVDPSYNPYSGPCPQCASNNIRPEKDVMDTWNTSSLTPYICKQLFQKNTQSPFEDKTFLPMNMRPQAHDIIRTWAFYTIVKSWMHEEQIPWHAIVISGYVLSEQNEKISKSKNNAPAEPEQLLKLYAPDAIRFWTASGTLGQDIAFSPDQIKIGQKLMNKLWNAFKFVHMNLSNYQHSFAKPTNLGVANQWMLDQTHQALFHYKKQLDNYEFGLALQATEKLFWSDFCDNYIEIIKDQFLNADRYNQDAILATKWTMHTCSFMILQMYAPYLPHITEYLYQKIFKTSQTIESLHLTQFINGSLPSNNYQKDMLIILEIIAQIRKLKTMHQLALRTELAHATISISDDFVAMLQEQSVLIKGIGKIQQLEITNNQLDSTKLEQKGETYYAWIVVK